MSNEWRTDEPEVGQVAWLKNDPPFGPVICFIGDRGKAWKFAHGAKCLCDPSCPPWLPITTTGEDRLKAEVDRLREGQRWRNSDEEPPTQARYLVLWWDGEKHIEDIYWWDGGWPYGDVDFWRPIGELPKEKTETGGAGDGPTLLQDMR